MQIDRWIDTQKLCQAYTSHHSYLRNKLNNNVGGDMLLKLRTLLKWWSSLFSKYSEFCTTIFNDSQRFQSSPPPYILWFIFQIQFFRSCSTDIKGSLIRCDQIQLQSILLLLSKGVFMTILVLIVFVFNTVKFRAIAAIYFHRSVRLLTLKINLQTESSQQP